MKVLLNQDIIIDKISQKNSKTLRKLVIHHAFGKDNTKIYIQKINLSYRSMEEFINIIQSYTKNVVKLRRFESDRYEMSLESRND